MLRDKREDTASENQGQTAFVKKIIQGTKNI